MLSKLRSLALAALARPAQANELTSQEYVPNPDMAKQVRDHLQNAYGPNAHLLADMFASIATEQDQAGKRRAQEIESLGLSEEAGINAGTIQSIPETSDSGIPAGGAGIADQIDFSKFDLGDYDAEKHKAAFVHVEAMMQAMGEVGKQL